MSNPGQAEENKDNNASSSSAISFSSYLPSSVIEHYSKYRNMKNNLTRKVIMNSIFEIDSKYDIIDVVGQGAYGIVVAAQDKTIKKKENSCVAIKKIEKAFEHRLFAKRTLRELKILRLLKHENIVGIHNILLPKSREDFEDLYLCIELMETDLASIIKSPQPLTNEHIKFFIYEILRGLKYMHSAGIIHRDLKPRNLLVNSNCDLKICDFGLSRTIHTGGNTGNMTDYVATRWYRPPELLLETKDYTPAIDMWSVGCIFAELIRRRPFLPGTETKHQLELIFEVFGSPSEEDIALVPKPRLRKFLRSISMKKAKSLSLLLPNADPQAIDLLKKMMVFDPKKRISVDEALQHPYLEELHCAEDEPTRDKVPAMEFEFENYNLTLQQLKDLIYEEILLYHYEGFRKEYFRKVYSNENPFKEVIVNDNCFSPGKHDSGEEDLAD